MKEVKMETVINNEKNKIRNKVLLLVLALAVFSFFELGTYGGMNLGFAMSYVFIFVASTACLVPVKRHSVFGYICGALSLAFSAVFFLNYSGGVKFLSFVAILILYIFYIGSLSGGLLYSLNTFKSAVNLFYIPLGLSFVGVSDVIRLLSRPKKSGEGTEEDTGRKKGGFSIGLMFLGLLIALPALTVIIALLCSADAAFAELYSRISKNVGEYIFCAILAVVFTPLVFGMILRLKKQGEEESTVNEGAGVINISLVLGFMGSIALVYLVYLFSQLAYVSGGFLGLLPENYSFADYARRGFFEMCALSVINLIILGFCTMLCRKKDARSDVPVPVKLFSGFFCAFNLFIIASSMAKTVMYVNRYGLTRKRILIAVFMVMLGVAFVCIALRLIFRKFKYIAVIVVLCSLIGVVCSLADVDRIIAEYNIEAYESGRLDKLDIDAIGELSDGAVPALYKFWETTDDPVLKERAERELSYRVDYSYTDDEKNDFRKFNLARYRAQNVLEEFASRIGR